METHHDLNTTTAVAGRIMVALDYATQEEAELLLDKLQGISCYIKVGMQLFYSAGPQFIRQLKERGYHVFMDLKLHDIPNTVKGAAHSLTRLEADMFNVHVAGGLQMMQCALEGVEQAMAEHPNSMYKGPTVIGVTQLTSTSQHVLNDQIGLSGSVEQAVVRYAILAQQAGLQGVVASPLEVASIKEVCNASFITVTPGIRPTAASLDDQSRVMTPKQAFAQGTDYIVIGRPITGSPDPRKALESIITSIIS